MADKPGSSSNTETNHTVTKRGGLDYLYQKEAEYKSRAYHWKSQENYVLFSSERNLSSCGFSGYSDVTPDWPVSPARTTNEDLSVCGAQLGVKKESRESKEDRLEIRRRKRIFYEASPGT